MKKKYWVIIGIALMIAVITVVWTEQLRAHSQEVTIVELTFPKPGGPVEDIVLIDVLNEHLRTKRIGEVRFYQGFQTAVTDNQFVAGNFSYNQIGAVRKKLEQLTSGKEDIEMIPVFAGLLRLNRKLDFSDDCSLKLIGEPGETPIESAVKLGRDRDVLTAHFYDGHTILFADIRDDDLKVLLITAINPPESLFSDVFEFLDSLFDW